jgi:hypothetical protein
MKSHNQTTVFLSIEANYISWVRNAINIFNGSMAIFLSAIVLTQSTFPSLLQDTLAIGMIVAGITGLFIGCSWLFWSTVEFRLRQKAFFNEKLDFTKERGNLWKYILAIVFFCLLLFLILFISIVVIKSV